MEQQDMSIDTSEKLDDGGNVLDQNDLSTYIQVLLAARNDAHDMVAVLRTKNIRFTSQIKQMTAAIQEASKGLSEKDAKISDLETRIAVLEHASTVSSVPSIPDNTSPSTIDHVA